MKIQSVFFLVALLVSQVFIPLAEAKPSNLASAVAETGGIIAGCSLGAVGGIALAWNGMKIIKIKSEKVGFATLGVGLVGGCIAGAYGGGKLGEKLFSDSLSEGQLADVLVDQDSSNVDGASAR